MVVLSSSYERASRAQSRMPSYRRLVDALLALAQRVNFISETVDEAMNWPEGLNGAPYEELKVTTTVARDAVANMDAASLASDCGHVARLIDAGSDLLEVSVDSAHIGLELAQDAVARAQQAVEATKLVATKRSWLDSRVSAILESLQHSEQALVDWQRAAAALTGDTTAAGISLLKSVADSVDGDVQFLERALFELEAVAALIPGQTCVNSGLCMASFAIARLERTEDILSRWWRTPGVLGSVVELSDNGGALHEAVAAARTRSHVFQDDRTALLSLRSDFGVTPEGGAAGQSSGGSLDGLMPQQIFALSSNTAYIAGAASIGVSRSMKSRVGMVKASENLNSLTDGLAPVFIQVVEHLKNLTRVPPTVREAIATADFLDNRMAAVNTHLEKLQARADSAAAALAIMDGLETTERLYSAVLDAEAQETYVPLCR